MRDRISERLNKIEQKQKKQRKPSKNGKPRNDEWPENMRGDAWEEPEGDPEPEPAPDQQHRPSWIWQPITAADLAQADYRPSWLVKSVLVRDQPCILGGPRKSLKTSLLMDLAISLASGLPFLGHFDIPSPMRVCLLSGESGPWTLQETAKRICAARGIDLAELADSLLLQHQLPHLSSIEHLFALRDGIQQSAVQVVILDPLYLSLMAGASGLRAENLYDVGPLLLSVSRVCLDSGVTPLLCHHTRKGSTHSKEPLDLDDLAFAGIAEFARQWVLISRRERYQPGTGEHRLWLNVGGSCGHGGLWSVDIAEGTIDEDFGGRHWDLDVATATDTWQSAREQAEEEKRQRQLQQDTEDDNAVMQALDLLDPDGRGFSFNAIQIEARLSASRMQRAATRLKAERTIEEVTVMATIGSGAQRKSRGLRRVQD